MNGVLKPIKDKVFAKMIDGFGDRTTKGGIIVVENDGTSEAIRPRWFEVWKIGPEQEDLEIGEYILVEHGRWTRKIKIENEEIFHVDNDSILLTTKDNPLD